MKFDPVRYRVTIFRPPDKRRFQIINDSGRSKFTAPATTRSPKIYIVTSTTETAPIYVGITKQSMGTRLRLGLAATGLHGYHGYPWRDEHDAVFLDVWCNRDVGGKTTLADVETIEAEIVFLIRQRTGQWPSNQTEIHFHPSDSLHREAAEAIVSHYLTPS